MIIRVLDNIKRLITEAALLKRGVLGNFAGDTDTTICQRLDIDQRKNLILNRRTVIELIECL